LHGLSFSTLFLKVVQLFSIDVAQRRSPDLHYFTTLDLLEANLAYSFRRPGSVGQIGNRDSPGAEVFDFMVTFLQYILGRQFIGANLSSSQS
jgi:hypothetical protein